MSLLSFLQQLDLSNAQEIESKLQSEKYDLISLIKYPPTDSHLSEMGFSISDRIKLTKALSKAGKKGKLIHDPEYCESEHDHWWVKKRDTLLALGKEHGTCFVIDKETILDRIEKLKGMNNISLIFFAIKANSNVDILDVVYEAGLGFETVSQGELSFVLERYPDIERDRILFTPNFVPKEEYIFGLEAGVRVTLDNIHPLIEWPEVFRGKSIFARIDTGSGAGHHKIVVTGGDASKFGIPLPKMEELARLVNELDISIVGLHCHKGSGITSNTWASICDVFIDLKNKHFPDVQFFDLGGGINVVQNPTIENPNIVSPAELNKTLTAFKEAHPEITLLMEPGRIIVAESVVLLATVTQLKEKGPKQFVGITTGFHSLIRPILYNAYHHIVNLSKLDEPKIMFADIVGMICESGDYLGKERYIPETTSGDIMLIDTVGAYGRSMSSFYNMRTPGTEIMLE